tara:strand:- start:5456 stop:5737 length:282 start_codon:yes stop_codon:yes gene_type:complete
VDNIATSSSRVVVPVARARARARRRARRSIVFLTLTPHRGCVIVDIVLVCRARESVDARDRRDRVSAVAGRRRARAARVRCACVYRAFVVEYA